MKLPVRHGYFEKIKAGVKEIEFRDAHITFVDESTGETITKDVVNTWMTEKYKLPAPLNESSIFTDERIIAFELDTKVPNRK